MLQSMKESHSQFQRFAMDMGKDIRKGFSEEIVKALVQQAADWSADFEARSIAKWTPIVNGVMSGMRSGSGKQGLVITARTKHEIKFDFSVWHEQRSKKKCA